MADKSNFTPDEWKVLLQGVIAAGIAITAAEPSGLWGLLKEGFAGGAVMAKAKTDPNTNALIKAVVNDFGGAEGSAARDGLKNRFRQSKPAEMKEACIATLRQAAAIVDTKAPGDAAAYKAWLQQNQPARCRSVQRRWISRHRRRDGQRRREGNAHRNLECSEGRVSGRNLFTQASARCCMKGEISRPIALAALRSPALPATTRRVRRVRRSHREEPRNQ